MFVEYGLCIITKKAILQYKTYKFEEILEKGIIQCLDSLNAIYNAIPDENYFKEIKSSIGEGYNFTTYNVEKYEIDSLFTLSEFEKYKKIKFKDCRQKALYNAESNPYDEEG